MNESQKKKMMMNERMNDACKNLTDAYNSIYNFKGGSRP